MIRGCPPAPQTMNVISKAGIETVLSRGDGVWVILFDGDPVRIFERVAYSDGCRTYKPTVYTSEGSARKTCRELNQQFAGNKFSVRKLL